MNDWVAELPVEVMTCDTGGIILEMNPEAARLFSGEGGYDLLGASVFDCHPEPSRTKLAGMMEERRPNAYYNSEDGEKRFFFQSPWFREGRYAGFVEISFPVPETIPHFQRG
jgi:hypothetical protein